ncbi:HAD-IA family hydrolase [Bacillus manliponensis]|uniref:HAD-IA family hydrolase n=1 Tax=Bacillus manliponensis TaxID=574376 RepID=UPI0035170E55
MSINILWDFDGTLVDSYPIFVRIFSDIIGSHIEQKEIMKHAKVSLTHAAKHYKLSQGQIQRMLEIEKSIHPSEYRLFPYVEDVLKCANSNCIVTYNSREEVKRILGYHGLLQYFSEIIGMEDGFPRKPEVGAYQYMNEKYHVHLAVGDRALDLLPAMELNIKTCAFQNVEINGADYYVNDYNQLLHMLEKSYQV